MGVIAGSTHDGTPGPLKASAVVLGSHLRSARMDQTNSEQNISSARRFYAQALPLGPDLHARNGSQRHLGCVCGAERDPPWVALLYTQKAGGRGVGALRRTDRTWTGHRSVFTFPSSRETATWQSFLPRSSISLAIRSTLIDRANGTATKSTPRRWHCISSRSNAQPAQRAFRFVEWFSMWTCSPGCSRQKPAPNFRN